MYHRRLFHFLVFLSATALLTVLACGDDGDTDFSRLSEDEVAVAAVHPPTRAIGLTSPLGFTFSRPIAPDGKSGYPKDPPATISPAVEGVWRWSSPEKLEFIPDEYYLPNREYRVTIDSRVAAEANLKLAGKKAYTFVAEPFRVVETRLFREPQPGRPGEYAIKGTVSFNHPVTPSEFKKHFSMSLEVRGAVRFDVDTEDESEHISFTSAMVQTADKGEELTAVLAKGIRPARGDVSIDAITKFTIRIPALEGLVVERVHFTEVSGAGTVCLEFNRPVDPVDLKAALTLVPVVDDLSASLGEGNSILLAGGWKYGTHYRIELSSALVSTDGYPMRRSFRGSASVGTLEPSLRIVGEGNYLSLYGDRKIAIGSMNIDKFTIELDRIYAHNLVPFLQENNLRGSRRYGWFSLYKVGSNIYRNDIEPSSKDRNREVITPVSLEEQLVEKQRGLFRLVVRKANERRLADSRFVIATDLGIVAKRSGARILVAVVSIHDLKPLAGVNVSVLSFNNRTLAEGQTDGDGIISFGNMESNDRGETPFVIVAEQGDDLGFLSFQSTEVPTGDLDVGGVNHPTDGYEAFLYTDRGIYRPGDTAHIAWVIRDTRRQPPAEFPLTLRIFGPDGKVFESARVTTGEGGMNEYTLKIPEWSQTGSYGIALHIDDKTVIGIEEIRVEDFMPDRMKVDVDLLVEGEKKRMARPGETIEAVVHATTLFGPPAAGRHAAAGLYYTQETVQYKEYRTFTFGDSRKDLSLPKKELGDRTTDTNGDASWEVELPDIHGYHGWIRAEVEVEVSELGGGRSVGGRRSVILSPVSHLFGLRREGGKDRGDYAKAGAPVRFDAVLLDLDGNTHACDDAMLRVYRQIWRTVLRRDPYGRYRYMSEHDEELVEERSIHVGEGINAIETALEGHGSYRMVIESKDKNARASIDFYVYGWGYSPWAMSNPDRVRIKTDKDVYSVGDEAHVEIEAPFEGLLLLTVERERVFHKEWITLDGNSADITIRLPEGIEPNAYIVATLLRSHAASETHAPMRAFGAQPIFMDRNRSTLDVEVRAPELFRSRARMDVDFRIPGIGAGDECRVTVAVVDEGILQITDFTTPSPLDYFLQKRRLSVGSYDIWGLLLPEYEKIVRQSSQSGGAGPRRKNLNPISVRRVKPVALWSGVVDGSSEWKGVGFDVPEFNGALRVMVVASSKTRFGSGEKLVRVRDPIVLTPNLPRFLAPGDTLSIPVQVFNGIAAGVDGELPIDLSIDLTGPVRSAVEKIEIGVGFEKEKVAYFHAHAVDSIGKARFLFTGEGGGESVEVTTEMAVRPPQPLDGEVVSGALPGGECLTTLLSDRCYEGTGIVTISVSGLPVSQFASAIPYLLRYPYGCLEQTTSRIFPLLYFADLAAELAPDQFHDRDADYFINSGLDRLKTMHRPGRGFAFWPNRNGSYHNPWASVYATHFLVEAEKKGYVVSNDLLEDALDNLTTVARTPKQSRIFRGWMSREMLSTRAYALYVLALADRPERGVMDYLAGNEWTGMNATARILLAGAYGLTGNNVRMSQLLPAQLPAEIEERSLGRTWSSSARNEAIQLAVLAVLDPDSPHVPVLVKRLGDRAKKGRWHNTQENAFALYAIGKLSSAGKTELAPGRILVDGEVMGEFGPEEVVVRGRDWQGRSVVIETEGPGSAYYSIIDEGVPRTGEEHSRNNGLVVCRRYLDSSGKPVDLECVVQGDVLVCHLNLTSEKGEMENVVIADLVPAGFEIENPRLMRHALYGWVNSKRPLSVEYLDVRDDRILVFTSADGKERNFYYGVRAVTVGNFVLPPVKAEAMYDPEVRSINGGGRVKIVAP